MQFFITFLHLVDMLVHLYQVFFYQSLQSMIWVFVAPSRDRSGSIALSPSLSPNSIAGISRHLTRLTQRVRLGGPPLHPHLHFLKLFFFPVTDGGPRVIFCLETGTSRQNSPIELMPSMLVVLHVFVLSLFFPLPWKIFFIFFFRFHTSSTSMSASVYPTRNSIQ